LLTMYWIPVYTGIQTVNYSYCLNNPTGLAQPGIHKKGESTPNCKEEVDTLSVSKCVVQITR